MSEIHVASQEANAVIDEEEAVRTLVTWKEARKNISLARLGHFSRECPDKFRNKSVSPAPVLITRSNCDVEESARLSLDELLQEIESFRQEWPGHRTPVEEGESDDTQACLLSHAPGREIIDTMCGRCVIGAQTREEHRAKLGPDAEDVQWHDTPPTVTF